MRLLGFGRGFGRLNEIVAYRLGERVFEHCRKPLGSRSRSVGFAMRKDAMLTGRDQHLLMTTATNRPDRSPQATTVGYLNEGLTLYL